MKICKSSDPLELSQTKQIKSKSIELVEEARTMYNSSFNTKFLIMIPNLRAKSVKKDGSNFDMFNKYSEIQS